MEAEDELASAVAESTSSSVSVCGGSSDSESWTVLDQDEIDTDQENDVTSDGANGVASGSERVEDISPDSRPAATHEDTDSDIETLDKCTETRRAGESEAGMAKQIAASIMASLSSFKRASERVNEGPESLLSVASDGIPIAEELSPGASHYLWSSDLRPVSSGSASATPDEADDEEESSIYSDSDDEDLEIIPEIDLSNLYPSEELPPTYAEITRGNTYNHSRNQEVNILLTGLLVVVVALVIGFGFGHFLGWSERLELHEQYAEVREEKLDELTNSLVTCMTGAEAMGGEDQDLDERVIQQLHEENRQLKEQLELVTNYDDKADEAMLAILRDRINDLASANADLEKEVARLRYAHSAMAEAERSKDELEAAMSHLKVAKVTLNDIKNENEQLKLAIGRARYGAPPLTAVSEASSQNTTAIHSDESKAEPDLLVENSGLEESGIQQQVEDGAEQDDSDIDISGSEITVSIEETLEISSDGYPSEVEKQDESPSPDSGISSLEDSTEWTLDEVIEFQEPQEIPPAEKVTDNFKEDPKATPYSFFQSFGDILLDSSKSLLKDGVDIDKAMEVVAKVKAKLGRIVDKALPKEESLESVKRVAADIETVLVAKWNEMSDFVADPTHADSAKETVSKLSKTLLSSMKRLKDAIKKNHGGLMERWNGIHVSLQEKWQKVLDKHDRDVKKAEAKEQRKSKKSNGEARGKTVRRESALPVPPPSWSYGASVEAAPRNATTGWMFKRSEKRKEARAEATRSDWVFERAKNRQQMHQFNDAEWHSKRFFNKKCSKDEQDQESCENLGEVSGSRPTSWFGKTKRKGDDAKLNDKKSEHSSKFDFKRNIPTQDHDDDDDDDDIIKAQGFDPFWAHKVLFDFEDDDDDEEEEDDEDDFDEIIRPVHTFFRSRHHSSNDRRQERDQRRHERHHRHEQRRAQQRGHHRRSHKHPGWLHKQFGFDFKLH